MRPPKAKNIMLLCEYAGTHCGLTLSLASQNVGYMCPRINVVSILIATAVRIERGFVHVSTTPGVLSQARCQWQQRYS